MFLLEAVISFGLITVDFLFGGGEYFLVAIGLSRFTIEKSKE